MLPRVRRRLLLTTSLGVAMVIAAAAPSDRDDTRFLESCEAVAVASAGTRCPSLDAATAAVAIGEAPEPPRPPASSSVALGAATTTTTPATATTTTIAPAATDAVTVAALPAADPHHPAVVVTPGENVPNPSVLVLPDRYLLFSNEARRHPFNVLLHISMLTSTDLRTWEPLPQDALPVLPPWAAPGHTWAPDIRTLDDGHVLYFTARLADRWPATQCIGVATAVEPTGPFTPLPEPIVCQPERGGSIDPRSFRTADGELWLHWKSDDNADVEGTAKASIYAAPLSADGLRFTGEAVRILEVDQEWEGRIVEAPDMVAGPDGRLWLFYSGSWFNQPGYGIGVASCESPAGPCTKPHSGPWLSSNAQGQGPGEASVFIDRDGVAWIAYSPLAQDYRTETIRPVALARVGFDARGPYLAAPAFADR